MSAPAAAKTAPAPVPDSVGIDVSIYQPKIDWKKVALTADFAFIKATEGTSRVDTSFAGNWQNAKSSGVLRGAYHFFHGDMDGAKQATHFLSIMGSLEDTDLPPIIDLEHAKKGEKSNTLSKNVSDWIQTVEAATKRKPMIYVSPGFWNEHMASRTDSFPYGNYPLWVANYGVHKPGLPHDGTWTDWTFWQYSGSGTYTGVHGKVDLDKFNGNVLDLWLFLGKSEPSFSDPGRMINCWSDLFFSFVGHELDQAAGSIPSKASKAPTTYVVKPGDTTPTIASKLHVRAQDLAQANGLPNLNTIRIGQVLKIPAKR